MAIGRPDTTPARTGVGPLLRGWRTARGMSQLDLALRAGFSARHVSFIETGRAQPSRHALVTLAETLDVPLRDRNRLLEAGGFARIYPETPLASDDLRHLRGVLQFLLDRHEPYPAVVLDRYSTCLMGNHASTRLLAPLLPAHLLAPPVNFLRITFHPEGLRRCIVNWDQVGRSVLHRAARELADGHDPQAAALLAEIRAHAGDLAREPVPLTQDGGDLLLPVHVRAEGLDLRLFSTIMTLGTPRDVTLQELHLETFFPADEASERAWRGLAPTGAPDAEAPALSPLSRP
jgi:transcriptional regulator with XRE-family HTH domain